MPKIDLSDVVAFDADGALQETADRASRRTFLRTSGIALGGALLAPGVAMAASQKGDVAIMNFALTLEYLESAFYASALKHAGLHGEFERFARTVHAHEKAHVEALRKALGKSAIKRPTFAFGATVHSRDAFAATSVKLEDTGVMAYQGQAQHIKSQDLLMAAISIHPVEARHAAWIRNITPGFAPAPAAFNPALTKAQVLSAVTATGFIS